MTSRLRLILVLVLSAGAHILPWTFWGANGQQSAGGDGEEAVTLAALPESLASLVEQWQKPVDVHHAAPSLPPVAEALSVNEPVQALSAPSIPQPHTALTAPSADTRPKVDTRPPPAPDPEPPTVAESAKSPSQPRAASKPQVQEQAKGNAKSELQGDGGHAKVTTGNSKREASALKQWGSAIRSRIERQKRKAAESGQVRLRVVVHSSGKLTSVQVLGPSGHSALDAAAIATVKRARLPKAPAAVTRGNHGFALTLAYRR